MSKPETYKPWTDGRGQPVMKQDPDGHFVTLADYQALEKRFYASNQAIHALETAKDAPAAATTEDADGEPKS